MHIRVPWALFASLWSLRLGKSTITAIAALCSSGILGLTRIHQLAYARLSRLIWTQKTCTYKTARLEERYWRTAERDRHQLHSSDAKFKGLKSQTEREIPLIMSYTPALLPSYRYKEAVVGGSDGQESRIPAKTICKWHRMVSPGPVRGTHPEYNINPYD